MLDGEKLSYKRRHLLREWEFNLFVEKAEKSKMATSRLGKNKSVSNFDRSWVIFKIFFSLANSFFGYSCYLHYGICKINETKVSDSSRTEILYYFVSPFKRVWTVTYGMDIWVKKVFTYVGTYKVTTSVTELDQCVVFRRLSVEIPLNKFQLNKYILTNISRKVYNLCHLFWTDRYKIRDRSI